MGNKIETGQENNPRSPKKMTPSQQQNYLSNKNKSAQKDGLYTEERLFENYDSNQI